jgi:hypothetical protein
MGNGNRSSLAPGKNLNPSVHWSRVAEHDWESVIEGVHKAGTVSAVFTSRKAVEACFKDVIAADFGLSVNISTSVENAREVAEHCGINRHSVEYSLGFHDPHDHLPDATILALSTMCGHGMVSFNFARKMLDMVKEGRRTPEQAAASLVRFCPCGIYNGDRAIRLIKEYCHS